MDAALIVLRFLQYGAAMILMGSSLFLLYAFPRSDIEPDADPKWARPLLLASAVVLCLSSLLQIAVQSIIFAGSMQDGLTWESLIAVVSFLSIGKAALVRAVAAVLGLAALIIFSSRSNQMIITATLAAIAVISLAWMGHAAATEGSLGQLHLVSDAFHLLAASVWIGALAIFLGLLLVGLHEPCEAHALHAALEGFSGVGSILVAVLVATGAVNSWILVGPDHVSGLWTTPYGRLLSTKLALFAGMLALAAANRFRLTPAFGRSLNGPTHGTVELAALRRSVAIETVLGFVVIGLVSWFGSLPPPAAM